MELLTPDFRFERVEDITPGFLKSYGIASLLLDIDNTLVSRATGALAHSVLAWIDELKAADISCCLLSNNWHKVVFNYAQTLSLPLVNKAMKPLPFAYIKALTQIGAKRESTAVIGDQIFTDILGARLCVMSSILVEPLSTTDLWYTQIFRKAEGWLLKK